MHHKLQSYDVWFLRYWAWQIKSFAILDNFLPIYFLKTRKSKFWKNEKRHLEISSFYKIVPKIRIMCYTAPEIWHITDVIIVIFHFGLFFALLLPLTAQEMKIFLKNEKNAWRCHHFTQVYQKSWYDKMFLKYGAWQM